ncbi:MAG: bifunctional aspartate kinase/homoserine dehydrogenase I [Myxococcota bacterium]
MTWTVLKFGGTSIGSPENLTRVCALVMAEEQPAVVVSALGSTTDRLAEALDRAERRDRQGAFAQLDQVLETAMQCAQSDDLTGSLTARVDEIRQLLVGVALLGEASDATRDSVLAYGEMLAVEVVTARLIAAGGSAQPIDSRRWCRTDARFGQAHVDEVASYAALRETLIPLGNAVPVIMGFVGSTSDGRTTTLGRGGSDYTAALVANALSAKELQIWSDVAGVMTADPAIVSDARTLERMTYGEALELATFGARVLHPRTLVPLLASRIPMVVRNTFDPADPGTTVDQHGSDDETRATSVTSVTDLALLDLRLRDRHHSPEFGERVHRALQTVTEQVWLVTHSAHGQALSLVVPQAQAHAVKDELERVFATELSREALESIRVRTPVALLTLVAEAMGRTPNVAGRMFAALGQIGVNVHTIGQSATARSISCVVDHADLVTAVRTVHAAFHLTHTPLSIVLLGTGVVGSQLLTQISDQRHALRTSLRIDPQLVGVATSAKLAFDAEGLHADTWSQQAETAFGPHGPVTSDVLDQLARLPVPILVDCTAAAGMEALYREAFARGIHVVAANKKPLTIAGEEAAALRDAARRAHRSYQHETTVGAALPVLSTLDTLIQTGDVVNRIVGSLSGTLGYLCDELSKGVPVDQAVADARERGFTEPRPQEDLGGVDAARKALILARRLGLDLEMDQVEIEPLVDATLLDIPEVEAFLEALKDARQGLADRVSAARGRGEVLRYLAVIDPAATPVLKVGVTTVGQGHPAFALSSSQSMVAFYTERYATHPLVVSGAGAGGAVTASGVLADIIRIGVGLRGG